jgi:DNA-directed RNA polymerase specialized sigma24 family protein
MAVDVCGMRAPVNGSSDAMQEVIATLPAPYDQLMRARYVEGRTADELAETFLLPVEYVQQDLHRGRLLALEAAVKML